MTYQSQYKTHHSDITSKIEGRDLGEMVQIWEDTAASEMRLNLMSTLKGKYKSVTQSPLSRTLVIRGGYCLGE